MLSGIERTRRSIRWAIWPLAFLAVIALFLMGGAGWAEPNGEDSAVVALQVTPTPTPTPIRSYLPWTPKDPSPTPTPTPTPLPGYTAQYFNNPDLSGAPALVRTDNQIDFDFGEGSPDPLIQTDGFSARWTRTLNLAQGDYNFFAYADDGVRLWVDDQLIIDEWREQQARQFVSARPLAAGSHTIRMEYFDRLGGAVARLGIVNTTVYPQPQNFEWGTWQGEYFVNPDLAGEPRLVRKDNNIAFDWGTGSPDSSIPVDNFSVRWNASLFLRAGDYNFFTYTDDGVRLFIDGALVINEWHDQGPTQRRSFVPLSEGVHFIRMEYFERDGGAQAQLWWHNGSQFSEWRGEYFSNKDLSGSPIVIRNDANIDFVWPGSPAEGVPHDGFSVRWTRILDLEAGDYSFKTLTDDGVRLWVDGFQGLNEWHNQPATEWHSDLPGLAGGIHFVRMEYFQDTSGAQARLTWQKLN